MGEYQLFLWRDDQGRKAGGPAAADLSERGGQVFVSSHSPDFVNGLKVDELFFPVKESGFTVIKAAPDDGVVRDLSKENQLGWLWRNHYIRDANL